MAKFEEEGYSDDKPECRAYIWEKMQEVRILFIEQIGIELVWSRMLTPCRCNPLVVHQKISSQTH